MTDDSRRDPALNVSLHAVPSDGRTLTATIQPLVPEPNHREAKRADGAAVERDSVVIHVSAYQRTNVASLLWNRLMPSLLKFQIDGLQLLQHPLPHRFPNDREHFPTRSPTAVREPQEVECFGFTLPASFPILHGTPAKLDQARLLRVQT